MLCAKFNASMSAIRCVFRALKEAWRATLRKFKEDNPAIKGIPKLRFPSLLKTAIERMDTITVLGKEKSNRIAENIRSGFRVCGVHPFDEREVQKRLPGYKENESESQLEKSITAYIKENRCPQARTGISTTKQRAKRIHVIPGVSVTETRAADVVPDVSVTETCAAEPNTGR